MATGLLYGDSRARRELPLALPDPVSLPWRAAALDRIAEFPADLTR